MSPRSAELLDSTHSAIYGRQAEGRYYGRQVLESQEPGSVRFVGVSMDCTDPVELAEFYLQLLGGRVRWRSESSVGIEVPGVLLIAQGIVDYRPPAWPGASVVHLDLTADDQLEAPQRRALALGANVADPQPDPRWTVLLDPAGHPFCITTVTPPP